MSEAASSVRDASKSPRLRNPHYRVIDPAETQKHE